MSIHDTFMQAVQHHQAGNFGVAEQHYRQVLQADPNHEGALNLLGVLAYQTGRAEQAVVLIRQALALNPWPAAYHSHLGLALQALGQLEQAIASFQHAVRLEPSYADAHSNLGDALRIAGRAREAVTHCRLAVQYRPDLAQAHGNLGNALLSLHELGEAAQCFYRALSINPNMATVHNSLAGVLEEQNKVAEAIHAYRQAIRLDPKYATAHCNLGMLLQKHGTKEEAILCFRRTLELSSGNIMALSQLVHLQQSLCDWKDLENLSLRTLAALDTASPNDLSIGVSPFILLTLPTPATAAQLHKCARIRANLVQHQAARDLPLPNAGRQRSAGQRIALGYLSANFRVHPIAHLVAELLEKHDRQRFRVHGFSCGPDDASAIRKRIARGCDQFVDLTTFSNAEAAQRIHSDQVDILIDLTSYTEDSRTQILALRPAPVQVNYLGFPGTMGAPFIDYILVDDFVVPPDQQPHFTEQLVQLPGCYQVNDSQRPIASRTPARAECGLPETAFVFCCFNSNYKITPKMFGVWMDLLKAVDGSVLWLLASNPTVPVNLRCQAQSHGVASERLVFAPPLPLAEHLARHRLAELFLDTFPYGAHTTCSDSLWAGCPVLTMMGDTFASRVAGSLLRAIGLPELITGSLNDYRDLALRLAKDPTLLANLRARLKTNRATTPLFDAGHFARDLEKAFERMWEMHLSGTKPLAFRV